MGSRLYRDLVIRGVCYATAQEAAAALGVQAQTVRVAARAGRLDGVGLGEHWPKPMPVRIRGLDFATAREAAAYFGLSVHSIHVALARGSMDSVGLPRRPHGGARRKPVAIGPLRFASHAEAGRALGFSPGYVSHVRRRGSVAGMQRLMAAAMRLEVQREAPARARRGVA
jgi:hypothetical protein